MDARTLRGYAGAMTALALAGSWFAISGNPFPQSSADAAATAAPAPAAVAQAADPAVHDLALARAYRDAAAKVRGDTSRRVAAAAAAPPQVVTITQAAPVAATRSS